jgi:hypothetical protein
VKLSPLDTSATKRPIVPAPDGDDDEEDEEEEEEEKEEAHGAFGIIVRGSRSWSYIRSAKQHIQQT